MKTILWLFSILLLFVSSATSQTQSVPADIIAKLRRQAQMTYVHTQIPHDEEYAAAVLSNGSVVYTMVSDRGGKFSLPLGIMLLLHTHPYGAQREPSDADKATAKKLSAPNCAVTVKEVWCAMPDGKIVPGVLLANKLSVQTAGVVDGFNSSLHKPLHNNLRDERAATCSLSGHGIRLKIGCPRILTRISIRGLHSSITAAPTNRK